MTAASLSGASAEGLVVDALVERGEFRLEVAFTAAPGEVVGLLGPNGAGKTTLLRALAGLTPLTSGTIRLDGESYDDVPGEVFQRPDDRRIGLVFQNYRLFPHLSVRENVAFGLRSHGVGRSAALAAADTWLARFALTDFAARKPGALSGGQAQRVALARALALEPRLLLLDEPLAALDARTRLDVRSELRRHLVDYAGPTLLITHDLLDAMVLADRLLVIEDGRIVQVGTPTEVARRPNTNYVARLVGLNLYPGEQTGSVVALAGGGSLRVTAPDEPAARPAATPVLVAIRPSSITLHTSEPTGTSARNVWAGTVAGLESLTDRVRVEVDAQPPALVDITAGAVADLGLSQGTAVWLSAKATDVDVYPAQPDAHDRLTRLTRRAYGVR